MKFYDMDGIEVGIGDYVQPIEGRKLLVISKGDIAEYPEEVLIGQQVEDIAAISILTAENLALQFRKVGESESNINDEILNILIGEN